MTGLPPTRIFTDFSGGTPFCSEITTIFDTPGAIPQSEYTVRWPGHIEKFLDLQNSGELDEQSLVQQWAYTPTRSEFTYMDITITPDSGSVVRWEFDIPGVDESLDRLWPSMAVATGIPFLVACEALLDDRIEGIQSPDNYHSDLDEIITRLKTAGAEITRK